MGGKRKRASSSKKKKKPTGVAPKPRRKRQKRVVAPPDTPRPRRWTHDDDAASEQERFKRKRTAELLPNGPQGKTAIARGAHELRIEEQVASEWAKLVEQKQQEHEAEQARQERQSEREEALRIARESNRAFTQRVGAAGLTYVKGPSKPGSKDQIISDGSDDSDDAAEVAAELERASAAGEYGITDREVQKFAEVSESLKRSGYQILSRARIANRKKRIFTAGEKQRAEQREQAAAAAAAGSSSSDADDLDRESGHTTEDQSDVEQAIQETDIPSSRELAESWKRVDLVRFRRIASLALSRKASEHEKRVTARDEEKEEAAAELATEKAKKKKSTTTRVGASRPKSPQQSGAVDPSAALQQTAGAEAVTTQQQATTATARQAQASVSTAAASIAQLSEGGATAKKVPSHRGRYPGKPDPREAARRERVDAAQKRLTETWRERIEESRSGSRNRRNRRALSLQEIHTLRQSIFRVVVAAIEAGRTDDVDRWLPLEDPTPTIISLGFKPRKARAAAKRR